MKHLIITIAICTIAVAAHAQKDEMALYRQMFKTADSLKNIGQSSAIDTAEVYKLAKELDEKHPSEFFNAASSMLNESKFNAAAFLFYVGEMRFKYYNATNPNYQASGDGALYGSLNYVFGEPINMYLRSDIDNMIFILKMAFAYCALNDYAFHPKEKDIAKYDEIVSKMQSQLIGDLEANKLKYAEEFAKLNDDFKNILNQVDSRMKGGEQQPSTEDDSKAGKKKGKK